MPTRGQPQDRQAGRDGRAQDDPPARGAGRDRRLICGPAPADRTRQRSPVVPRARRSQSTIVLQPPAQPWRLPDVVDADHRRAGSRADRTTSIGAALAHRARPRYSTSMQVQWSTRRPLSSVCVARPRRSRRRRARRTARGRSSPSSSSAAASSGSAPSTTSQKPPTPVTSIARQAALGIERRAARSSSSIRMLPSTTASACAAAVDEVRAVARLPEEDIGAGAAEGAVGVRRARVGAADLDVVAGLAEHRVDAEQADLDVGPPGADQDVAVLQGLIAAAARERRILRLQERIVRVVVVGADLLRGVRRAETMRLAAIIRPSTAGSRQDAAKAKLPMRDECAILDLSTAWAHRAPDRRSCRQPLVSRSMSPAARISLSIVSDPLAGRAARSAPALTGRRAYGTVGSSKQDLGDLEDRETRAMATASHACQDSARRWRSARWPRRRSRRRTRARSRSA